MLAENALQTIECGEVLAVFLETADPRFAFGVFGQPGVGLGDQQHTARIEALVH